MPAKFGFEPLVFLAAIVTLPRTQAVMSHPETTRRIRKRRLTRTISVHNSRSDTTRDGPTNPVRSLLLGRGRNWENRAISNWTEAFRGIAMRFISPNRTQ